MGVRMGIGTIIKLGIEIGGWGVAKDKVGERSI